MTKTLTEIEIVEEIFNEYKNLTIKEWIAEGIKAGIEKGKVIGMLECANENHRQLIEENIAKGRKQLIEEILNDSRLNSQINESGIRLILKEKLQKEGE